MRWAIPTHWRWETIGTVAEIVGGGTPPSTDSTNFDPRGIPWITPADLSGYNATYIERGARSLSAKGYERCGARLMPPSAVLFSSRAPIGYCVIARTAVATSQGFKSLVLREQVLPEFARYYLLASKKFIESRATGTTFKEISGRAMAGIPFPLAPIAEQRRIVQRVDEFLSAVEASAASLLRAKANAKRARASVLKAAVEGRLVPTEAELAAAEGSEYEPADVLLERILSERQETRVVHDRSRSARVREIIPDALPVPAGWTTATFDQLTIGGFTNGLYAHKSLYGRGTPIVRIDDFQDWKSRSANELRQVDIDQETAQKYSLAPGQLVINRVNSLTHLGKCLAVEPRHVPAVFESNMMRAEITPLCRVSYLAAWLRSRPGRAELTQNAKWAVNQASINQSDVASTRIPLPPLAEQDRIVSELARRTSVLDSIEATIDANFARCEQLRQSILKRAFEGRLLEPDAPERNDVTTDPDSKDAA